VAQVRLILRLHLLETDISHHEECFAYVQWFTTPRRTTEQPIDMYVVSRLEEDGVRNSAIIPIASIARFIQLVPKFGSIAAPELMAHNSMDICRDYYINSFADKEIYQAVW
jgi:hypothetical protein